jgi:multicomponent Na+:H+ antiporter subunit B
MFLLVAGALTVLTVRNLFVATMLLGIVSFIMALVFISLDAVDVAFTEAAVGAGISTVLYIGTLALVGSQEKAGIKVAPGAMAICLAVGAVLVYATYQMPTYGSPDNPVHTHVAPRYIQTSPIEIGVPNMVTSVLSSYRGFDTFGETTVVFTAGIGVLLILSQRRRRKSDEEEEKSTAKNGQSRNLLGIGSDHDLIPHVIAKLLIPFILLFALYVQFHGDYGPGGGFQAGVIFAAGFILYALIFGLQFTQRVLSQNAVLYLVAFGVLLYGGVGVVGILLGGNFLDYNVLSSDPVSGQHLGILLIELGVGITVAAAMLAIYYAFVGRADPVSKMPD